MKKLATLEEEIGDGYKPFGDKEEKDGQAGVTREEAARVEARGVGGQMRAADSRSCSAFQWKDAAGPGSAASGGGWTRRRRRRTTRRKWRRKKTGKPDIGLIVGTEALVHVK